MSINLYLTSDLNNIEEEEEGAKSIQISDCLRFFFDNYSVLEKAVNFSLKPFFTPPESLDTIQIESEFINSKRNGNLDAFWERHAKLMIVPPNLLTFKECLVKWVETLEKNIAIKTETDHVLSHNLKGYHEHLKKFHYFEYDINIDKDFFCDTCPEDGIYCKKENECLKDRIYYRVHDLIEELKDCLAFVYWVEENKGKRISYNYH